MGRCQGGRPFEERRYADEFQHVNRLAAAAFIGFTQHSDENIRGFFLIEALEVSQAHAFEADQASILTKEDSICGQIAPIFYCINPRFLAQQRKLKVPLQYFAVANAKQNC